MVDLNPFSLWRRLLALPNESRTKTILMAFLVSGICALMVSGATVYLRPIQTANRAAEQQAAQQRDGAVRQVGRETHRHAVEGRRIAGMGELLYTGEARDIQRVAVLPECQGRGLGRRLLEGMIWAAGRTGHDLTLCVGEDNARAIHLYESLGFTRRWRRCDWSRGPGGMRGASPP